MDETEFYDSNMDIKNEEYVDNKFSNLFNKIIRKIF